MGINDYHFCRAVSRAEDIMAGFARRQGRRSPRRTAHRIAVTLMDGGMLSEPDAHLAMEALDGSEGDLGRLRDGVERQWMGMEVEAVDVDLEEDNS